MFDIVTAFKSSYTVEIVGTNPERFLNTAAAKGIYISKAVQVKDGLRLDLSRAAFNIMNENMPEGLVMNKLEEHGAARFFRKFRKRVLLLVGIPAVLAAVFLFTRFVWRVEIDGGTPELQKEVAAFLEKGGLRPGVLIGSVDQNKIKRDAILSIDDLMWLWVDIKGTTAYVNIAGRDMPPEMAPKEPANVIASESGVIEKITTLQGAAMVKEGETVEKGSLLISGAIESERTQTMFRHAEGSVTARVWREKTVLIPKITVKRTPTGNKRKIRAIKIKKFIVNFSLNSSILYPKYDRIRVKYKVGKLPLEFISDSYLEVETENIAADLEKAKAEIRAAFEKELTDSGAEIAGIEQTEIDRGDYLEFSLTAQCLTDIGKTVPIQ